MAACCGAGRAAASAAGSACRCSAPARLRAPFLAGAELTPRASTSPALVTWPAGVEGADWPAKALPQTRARRRALLVRSCFLPGTGRPSAARSAAALAERCLLWLCSAAPAGAWAPHWPRSCTSGMGCASAGGAVHAPASCAGLCGRSRGLPDHGTVCVLPYHRLIVDAIARCCADAEGCCTADADVLGAAPALCTARVRGRRVPAASSTPCVCCMFAAMRCGRYSAGVAALCISTSVISEACARSACSAGASEGPAASASASWGAAGALLPATQELDRQRIRGPLAALCVAMARALDSSSRATMCSSAA